MVNWNSADHTIRAIESLYRTDYPPEALELVVIDNGSIDGSADVIAQRFPELRMIRNEINLGFAEACNQGMRNTAGLDMVALVNNDALVEPGWLEPLVDTLVTQPDVGAAAAMLILDPDFVTVDLEVSDATLGLDLVAVDGEDVTHRCVVRGATEIGDPEWPLRTTHELTGSTRIHVPAPSGAGTAKFSLDVLEDRGARGPDNVVVTVHIGGTPVAGNQLRRTHHSGGERVGPGDGGSWSLEIELEVPAGRVEILNGLGTALDDGREGYDIGFGEPVDRFDVPTMIEGFCGGGVLLRVSALAETGLFDPRFFAYYEDTDLSWRMRRAGWRIVPVATSRIHHHFGGAGGSAADWFFFLNYRNWLLTVIRNGSRSEVMSALARAYDFTRRSIRSNILSRIRHRRRPSLRLTSSWIRVWLAVLTGTPGVLCTRRRRKGSRIGRRPTTRVRAWLQPEPVPKSVSMTGRDRRS